MVICVIIVGDIEGKNKGNISRKKRSKKDKADSVPSGTTEAQEAEELKQDQEQATDEGPVENLMEKGKKIALDDFQMIKVIGRGSFGKVYLVRHKESQKPYALKILKKD